MVAQIASDTAAVRKAMELGSQDSTILAVGGVAAVLLSFVPNIPPLGQTVLLFGGIGTLLVGGLVFGRRNLGLDPDRPPDILYLTSHRVIVDVGKQWTTVVEQPLTAVRDVVLWQTSTMRRSGLTWLYVVPIGAMRLEVQSGGETVPAPGVLEVQNIPVGAATWFRAEILRRARLPTS